MSWKFNYCSPDILLITIFVIGALLHAPLVIFFTLVLQTIRTNKQPKSYPPSKLGNGVKFETIAISVSLYDNLAVYIW